MTRVRSSSTVTSGVEGSLRRVKMSMLCARRPIWRLSSRMYTFIPPVSRVPGRPSGELCMETTAILHTVPLPVLPVSSTTHNVPMIIRISRSTDDSTVHVQVAGAQVIFIRLRASKEIEAAQTLLDGPPQRERLGQQAHGEAGICRVIAAVVQQQLVARAEAQHPGHPHIP